MAHTVCVSRDGAVYACGWNSSGQLGTATQKQRSAVKVGQAGGAGAEGGSGSGQLGTARWGHNPPTRDVGQPATAAAAGEVGSGRLGQEGGRQLQQQEEEVLCVSSLRPVLVEAPALEQEDVVQVSRFDSGFVSCDCPERFACSAVLSLSGGCSGYS
jgi:hypothetical protein